jgi:hypothetical protein
VTNKHWVFDLHGIAVRQCIVLHRNSRLGETAEGRQASRQAVCVESICREDQTVSMIAIGQIEARDSAFSKAIQIKQLGMFVENNMTHAEERLSF